MKKYYLICPDCRTRMRRTGEKRKVTVSIEGHPIYQREYECPGCGRIWTYDEERNFFF